LIKKLGIALGSGSSRGWSHIGVLNALEESEIKVDYISGTSIGSLVGAVYSIGDIKAFEKFARSIDWKNIVSFIDVSFPVSGLISGKKLFKMLSEYYGESVIENLPIPYCAVAADVITGEEIRFNSGRVIDSVRASVAIPGVFTPFEHEGRVLVDGGIVNPVPVNVVRKMGADIVIAVDLNSCTKKDDGGVSYDIVGADFVDYEDDKLKNREKRIVEMLEEKYLEITGAIREKFDRLRNREHHLNILEIIDNTTHIMQRSITENQFKINSPEVIIKPQLGDFRLLDFDRAVEAIDEGYKLTMMQIDKIKSLLH